MYMNLLTGLILSLPFQVRKTKGEYAGDGSSEGDHAKVFLRKTLKNDGN